MLIISIVLLMILGLMFNKIRCKKLIFLHFSLFYGIILPASKGDIIMEDMNLEYLDNSELVELLSLLEGMKDAIGDTDEE